MDSELAGMRSLLEEMRSLDGVKGVCLIARTGPFIMGDAPRMEDPQPFASMMAVMLRAAERTSMEFDRKLEVIQVRLGDTQLLLRGAGPRHIVVAWVDGGNDVPSMVNGIDRILMR